MEITGNKYLHKKFKKQTSCSPIYNVEDKNDNVLIPVVSNGQCGEIYAQKLLEHRGSTEAKAVNFLLFKDNNYLGSVPNVKSTNYDGSLVTDRSSELAVDRLVNDTLDNQSSISKVAVSINVATTCSSAVTRESEECKNKYRISDEPNIVRQTEQKHMMNLVKTSNVTSCISTTTTSLLANELKENIIRNFSFDTEVNISEPTTQKNDKSSIFDTVYSKYSVISERPNATSIKSDTEEVANKSSGIIYNKSDTSDSAQKPDAITPEKKQNCPEPNGGKYVCTYCNLACSKPSVLQKHIRAHTNERPYPCVSCGFSFKTRSNLYKHCRSRTHANRVMGNKHVQTGAGQMEIMDIDNSSEKNEDRLDCADEYIEDKSSNEKMPQLCEKIAEYSKFNVNNLLTSDQSKVWEQKSKPYKPRFHTAKIFFEENKLKENDSKLDNVTSAHFRALPNPIIIENIKNKTESQESPNIRSNPDILKLRINELIHKNNSIMNCDDAVVIRRRNVDTSIENVNNNDYISQQVVHWQQPAEYKNTVDEPLNLTAKNRKRCLSDSDNTQKSLIKELLLKNLSTDPNLQCPYCKMIFQTVTELEMHKLKYCNAKTSNIRYARSSSVNVASILTQNKNAFDNIPHMQHTTFPLKSPGPCLGKTRLIENEKQAEKYRTFSFDDNVILHHTQSDSPSFNKYMLQSAVGTYPLSPQIKKNPIRLFGGEVKITQTSGETRSFKIESESINKMQEEPQHFMEFNANLSENLVIKSGLHSGGTVLQNKTNYSPKIDSLPSPNILRMYDNSDIVSPSLNLQLLKDKPKFTFDNITQPSMCQNDKLLKIATNEQFTKRGFPCRDKPDTNYSDNGLRLSDIQHDSEKEKELYKSNLIDFGQKACKLLAPNLKPPNMKLSGLPISLPSSDKIFNTLTVTMAPSDIEKDIPIDKQHLENLNFAKKQISLQQKMAEVSQSQHVYNPMNLFVNGKVIPYVPGIPGPVVDVATDHIYNPIAIGARAKHSKEMPNSPRPIEDSHEVKEKDNNTSILNAANSYERLTPTIIVDSAENRSKFDTKSLSNKAFPNFDKPVDVINRLVETKTTPSSATVSSPDKMSSKEESRKFVRPTSLALKPTLGTFKSHHGLTPTMFNQALISPDTPRVAKKYCQQYLNGNYFSYLGLKSSTKSVYCTLNKTQPFYVKHFKKLSMYSEWRQQESKIDSLSVSAYDSRQQQQKYTMAGHAKADFIAHSSYKFIKTESSCTKEDGSNKSNSVFGGYESNEDYTYIRGRGRGRYVCEQCGIRCKKPSMLKKHIRTHSDDRPYTCEHCNFSFKTKGNLTKHMKSKAHSKKYAATSSTLTQNSVSTSSDSDESDGESSDESTRLQEHEAAHCLLSLAHKNNQPFNIIQETNSSISSTFPSSSTTVSTFNISEFPNFLKDDKFLKNSDEISQVTNTNFAKNKILDETSINFHTSKHLSEAFDTIPNSSSEVVNNVSQYLGESEKIRPLTYPYLQTNFDVEKSPKTTESRVYISKEKYQNQESITAASYLQRPVIKHTEYNKIEATSQDSDTFEAVFSAKSAEEVKTCVKVNNSLHNLDGTLPTNIVYRKRKLSSCSSLYKVQRSENVDSNYKAVDLRVLSQNSPVLDLSPVATSGETFNGFLHHRDEHSDHKIVQSHRTLMLNPENLTSDVSQSLEVVSSSSDQQLLYSTPINDRISEPLIVFSTQKPRHNSFSESNSSETFSQNSDTNERIIGKIIDLPESSDKTNDLCVSNRHADRSRSKTPDYLADPDQSAMQTLAEIAIKRVKLEKNILAKNVASEYLKLALNCDGNNTDGSLKKFVAGSKESVNELIVKPEDNKNCSICSKNFSKPSQLRLHMNIHYLERPFRCESCSVSFRTKGHLQKHERSASHHNKLSTSPALSSSEPRPFKCTDCNIAFRIHGHLAKHLRSKMHIMKLECLSKIPFGLYAELERANSLLTEINTTDGDLCLESLKILARKLFSNDPNKLDQVNQSDRQNS